MMRLNLLPDFKAMTGEPYDRMVDEDGRETIIHPRVRRFLGRVTFILAGLPMRFGGWARITVIGGAWDSWYERKAVRDRPFPDPVRN